jgi:hypothetical protein
VALIQRSCGYSLRATLSIADIQAAITTIKEADPECVVVVDNCYGEFTEPREPGEANPPPIPALIAMMFLSLPKSVCFVILGNSARRTCHIW